MKWKVWRVNHELWLFPLKRVNPILDAAVKKLANPVRVIRNTNVSPDGAVAHSRVEVASDECELTGEEYEELSGMFEEAGFLKIR